jgi:hypothetical protein
VVAAAVAVAVAVAAVAVAAVAAAAGPYETQNPPGFTGVTLAPSRELNPRTRYAIATTVGPGYPVRTIRALTKGSHGW